MNKLDTQSFATVANRLEELRQLFPSCFTESENGLAVDFDQLRSLLSVEVVEGAQERYRFTWPGKRQAIANANARTGKTLRPVPESSVEFEKTKNLYIEGDNLDALKLLLKSYRGQVKCIYIDPPYNTGKDFVYRDDFRADEREFALENGDVDAEGHRMVVNKETDGRYHTNWLNMMYPRLILARDLLAEDGVIFISIDDHEVDNLLKIGSELFGNCNRVGVIVWKKKTNGNNMGYLPPVHDYIICFAKRIDSVVDIGYQITAEELERDYSNPDNDYRGPWTTSDLSANHKGPYFKITNPNTGDVFFPPEGRYWVFNEEEVKRRIEDGRIIFGKTGTSRPVQKVFLKGRKLSKRRAESWWDNHGLNEDATNEQQLLLGVAKIFLHPKPSELIVQLLKISTEKVSVILDFFSGSATTAHAVMQLNAEDGGQRQFIMVQLPEACAPDSTAYQAGYQNICQIGEERIRRAGAKIKAENPLAADQLDTGFRVLRVDSSNINESIYQFPQDLQQGELEDQLYIKEGRTPEDLLFQTILNLGLPLSVEYTVETLDGQRVFNVGSDHLIACFEDTLSLETVTAIAQKKPNYAVFLDSAMTDSLLANIEQVFKTYSAGTDWKVL